MKLEITNRIIYANKLIFFCLFFLLALFTNKTFSQNDTVDIYDMNLSQLSQLKISSASKAPQSISEIPATIYIITAADIKENGYFTLEEALSDLPGFQFRNTLGLNSYVFQRGIPNQNNLTLILIDGVQINELNSGGFYGGAQYNLSNVERIEVIYGPASVAYGTNAISGVINIKTKDALETQTGINTLIGNFKTTAGDVSYGYANKKKTFGVRVSGMFKRSEKADLKREAGDFNWSDQMDNFENDYSFDAKIHYKGFTLGTNYLFKQPTTTTNTKSIGTIYNDHGTSWNIQFINNYLKYTKQFSEKLSLSAVLYNRNTTVLSNSVYYVVDTAQIGYYRPNNLTGLENVINYYPKKFFSFTGGLVFEFERLSEKASMSYSDSPENRPPRPPRPNMLNNYLLSVYAEPRFVIFKNFYLSGGIRFDQSSIYDQVFTPRAGLSYHFRKQIIRISYAEAFRAPKPWDYYDGQGNSSLVPEKMKSIEFAVTMSFIDKIKIDIVGYRNQLFHAITKDGPGDNYRWINKGKIDISGAELFLRLDFEKFKTSLNYTFSYSIDEYGLMVPEISMHTANASFTYSFNDHIKINLRANYYGKRRNPQYINSIKEFYVKPYILFDGALSLLNYKGITVQIIAKNILNSEYYHTSNRDPERYRQPQFTIMFSVGYSLNHVNRKGQQP